MTDSSEFSSHSHGEASSPEELFSLAKAHGESFPVLKAFQNYLDQERERARRRTMVLVLSFLGVVVALIIAFVVLFVSFFNVVLQNNEQQQVRMLSLVTGERAATVVQPVQQPVVVRQPVSEPTVSHAETPAAEKPLTREDLVLLIRELKAQPEVPQPEVPQPVAASAAPPAAPAKPAATPAPVKKTGVLSPVSKQEQMERLRQEEEARKARAAERKRLAEEEAAAKAKAALAAAEQKTAQETAPAAGAAVAPSTGERVQLKRRPGVGGNPLPKGKESDTIYLQTRSGVIPFRSVLPATNPDVYQ